MPRKVMRDQMQLRMEPTLVDAVRVYAEIVRQRTGVRTVSVAEATRMAIRAGLAASGVDPDDPSRPVESRVARFKIYSRTTGHDFGVWEATTATEALSMMEGQAGQALDRTDLEVRELGGQV